MIGRSGSSRRVRMGLSECGSRVRRLGCRGCFSEVLAVECSLVLKVHLWGRGGGRGCRYRVILSLSFVTS